MIAASRSSGKIEPARLPTLSYFHEVDRGGHFAMWEYPELFATELRAAFRPLRKVEVGKR